MEEYRIDGFRFDYTRGIGWTSDLPQYGILGWSTALRDAAPEVYQIAEHLAADPGLIRTSDLDAGWHDSFHDVLLNEIWESPTLLTIMRQVVDLYEYSNSGESNRYDDRTQSVNATVTHDEQSLIQEMAEFKGISLERALVRDLLYSTFTFTSLGIPMIWQGQELGMQSGWQQESEKLSYRPMDWSLEDTQRGQRHLDVYRRLIQLRKTNPALTRGTLVELERFYDERSIVYGFKDESWGNFGDAVTVVANLSSEDQTLSDVPWLSSGTWYEVLTDQQITVSDSIVPTFDIPAFSARVYANTPPVGIAGDGDPVPTVFSLGQNFPNPFNPVTRIEFSLEDRGETTLIIRDLLGREVTRLVSGVRDRGHHSVTWDGTDHDGRPVASGVYLYTLITPAHTATRKLLLLR